MNGQYMEYQPSVVERFWRKLGFRYHLTDLDVDDVALPGWMLTQSRIHFNIADRLRLLLTGRLHLDIRQAANVPIDECKSAVSFRIGEPFETTH